MNKLFFLEAGDQVEVQDTLQAVSKRAAKVCSNAVKRVCANRKLRDGRSITGRLTSSIFCKNTVRSMLCFRYRIEITLCHHSIRFFCQGSMDACSCRQNKKSVRDKACQCDFMIRMSAAVSTQKLYVFLTKCRQGTHFEPQVYQEGSLSSNRQCQTASPSVRHRFPQKTL